MFLWFSAFTIPLKVKLKPVNLNLALDEHLFNLFAIKMAFSITVKEQICNFLFPTNELNDNFLRVSSTIG